MFLGCLYGEFYLWRIWNHQSHTSLQCVPGENPNKHREEGMWPTGGFNLTLMIKLKEIMDLSSFRFFLFSTENTVFATTKYWDFLFQ